MGRADSCGVCDLATLSQVRLGQRDGSRYVPDERRQRARDTYLETRRVLSLWSLERLSEVVARLGRCLHVLLGIECEEPRSPAHTRPETTIFLDRSEKDATAVAPTAIKFHPVLAEEQHALRKAFEHVDAQWVQIFLRAAKAQGYGETRPPRAGEL